MQLLYLYLPAAVYPTSGSANSASTVPVAMLYTSLFRGSVIRPQTGLKV